MLKKTKFSVVIAVSALALLAGCQTGPMIGSSPSSTAPQIVNDPDNASGRIWNNIALFGPVPAQLAQTGADVCRSIDPNMAAYGYHPTAKDYDGNAIVGGGYLCLTK